MKKIVHIITFLFLCSSYSQKLTKDISLSKKIDETSGLEIVDGQFITHNDSGGDPKLYYLDKSPMGLLSGVIQPKTSVIALSIAEVI